MKNLIDDVNWLQLVLQTIVIACHLNFILLVSHGQFPNRTFYNESLNTTGLLEQFFNSNFSALNFSQTVICPIFSSVSSTFTEYPINLVNESFAELDISIVQTDQEMDV